MEILVCIKESGNALENAWPQIQLLCGNEKDWSEKKASICSAKENLSGLNLSQDYHCSP